MQCKKCNAFIPEGYLYCPECGEEIIIVSDFEIKLEDNIDTTSIANTIEIPDVNKEIDKQILSSATQEIPDVNNLINRENEIIDLDIKKPMNPLWWVLIGFCSLLVIFGLIVGIISICRYLSYDYQCEKAAIEANNGEVEKAINTLKHAISLDSDKEGKILLAQCYIANSNYDAAIAVLIDTLNDYPDDIDIYDTIVDCYKKQGDSRGIHELIENSGDSNLALRYSDYVSITPNFSLASGTYIEPDPIKLSAPEGGKIYYTTDGSEPTQDSLEYMGPIPLDPGVTQISAIYINSNGIVSEVVTNVYSVELNIPDNPVLLLPSGSISKPELVGVSIPDNSKVYYTTDGSTPDEKSKEYRSPLLMPLGKSKFSFVAINEEGIASDIVTGVYDLEIVGNIDKSAAEYAISYQLTAMGELILGNSYIANYGYSKDNNVYYIIEEYIGDKRSDRTFAVDASTGALYTFDKKSFVTNPF